MLYRSLLSLCLAPVIAATTVEIYAIYEGGGSIDLGGGSNWSDNRVEFRIDGGEWKTIKNAKSTSPCSVSCDSEDDPWGSEFTLGDLGGREFWICQNGGSCVPGDDDFSCKIWYNGEEKFFEAGSDGDFIGIAVSNVAYCGGMFEHD